ncbi:MAG TPA: hypothetical protein VGM26_07740 [Rhizomicrobium sp.]|jgi:hypothetical protein
MQTLFATILLGAFAILPAMAQQPMPGTNMPPDFYPQPRCEKPDGGALPKSPGVQDQAAMLAYNLKIREFNRKAEAFNACIKTYVDNAQNDIIHIQEIVHAAVTNANQH